MNTSYVVNVVDNGKACASYNAKDLNDARLNAKRLTEFGYEAEIVETKMSVIEKYANGKPIIEKAKPLSLDDYPY